MTKASATDTTVCRNRKASYRFEILEKLECGMVLVGSEVKSLREKAVSLDEAYAFFTDDGLWLIGCHIAPYAKAHSAAHEPLRKRKLLIHTHQLHKIKPRVEQKGFTLVPLRIYFNERGIAKLELALARGKADHDKRQSLKAREDKREMDRAMRRRR
jgi:SsrA-binding protein